MDSPAILGGPAVIAAGLPQWPISDDSIMAVFEQLSASGDWGRYHGPHPQQLISRLQSAYHTEHVTLTSSGTSAVELALRAAQVGEGDEVILAAYDFKANFINVSLLGARPVLVDIGSDDAQLDVEQVATAVTERTKAIIASHLHGGIVDVHRLREIANERQLVLIEDCCQISPQAQLQQKTLGSIGDLAVLSFGGSKLLTAGRGGAVISQHAKHSQRIKLYQERGNSAYPLSEMQAAVLLPQFDLLPERQLSRHVCVSRLSALLNNKYGLRPISISADAVSDFYKFGFWYDQHQFSGLTREGFCQSMRAEGIPIDPGFSGLHRIHASRRYHQAGELVYADQAHDCLVIVHHPFLLGGEQAAEGFIRALDKIRQHATILTQHFQS